MHHVGISFQNVNLLLLYALLLYKVLCQVYEVNDL